MGQWSSIPWLVNSMEDEIEDVDMKQEQDINSATDKAVITAYYETNNNTGTKMSLNDCLSYVRGFDESSMWLQNCNTVEQLDHLEQLLDIWKNKEVLISASPKLPSTMESFIDIIISKCLFPDKNTFYLSYENHIHDDGVIEEMLFLSSRFNHMRCDMGRHDGLMYDHLIRCIKATRDRNLLVDIKLESEEPGFSKLLTDLGWPMDEAIISWINSPSLQKLLLFDGDSTEYRLIKNDQDGNRDSSDQSDSEGYCSERWNDI